MNELLKKLKNLEKSFSENNNGSAIIFDEAKKQIIASSKLKISESDIELLDGIKSIVQTLYYGISWQFASSDPESIVKYPEAFLTLRQISSEIIDIIEELVISVIHGRNMVGFGLTRMFKERILYLMILFETKGKLLERGKIYYDFYKEFIGKFVSENSKEMTEYYWWKKIYPKKSISQLMADFKIDGYSHDSYHSHGGYGTHLDCNLSREITDSKYKNASQELVYEYFWLAGYELLALSIDGYSSLKGFIKDDYHESAMRLLTDLYDLWGQAESDYYSSLKK